MANSNTPAEVTALRSKQLRQDAIRSHLNHRDASEASERIQVCFCQWRGCPFFRKMQRRERLLRFQGRDTIRSWCKFEGRRGRSTGEGVLESDKEVRLLIAHYCITFNVLTRHKYKVHIFINLAKANLLLSSPKQLPITLHLHIGVSRRRRTTIVGRRIVHFRWWR